VPGILNHARRAVWLLARPLEGVPVSSVTQGNFPILHWAVFISPWGWGGDTMKHVFDALQCWNSHTAHFIMGTIHEVRVERGSRVSSRKAYAFNTADFIQQFAVSSVAFAGTTEFNDEYVNNIGASLFPMSLLV
jgi:hypothetical protein